MPGTADNEIDKSLEMAFAAILKKQREGKRLTENEHTTLRRYIKRQEMKKASSPKSNNGEALDASEIKRQLLELELKEKTRKLIQAEDVRTTLNDLRKTFVEGFTVMLESLPDSGRVDVMDVRNEALRLQRTLQNKAEGIEMRYADETD